MRNITSAERDFKYIESYRYYEDFMERWVQMDVWYDRIRKEEFEFCNILTEEEASKFRANSFILDANEPEQVSIYVSGSNNAN